MIFPKKSLKCFILLAIITLNNFNSVQGIIDALPIVSQLKSLVQVISGDHKGAKQTQINFSRQNPAAGIVRSIVEAAKGDFEGAKETQKIAWTTLSNVYDGIPVVGHIKGGIHYAVGDSKGGDQSMRSASRSVGVVAGAIGGGLAGGPAGGAAGAVAGGVAVDSLITGIESGINKEYSPSGVVHGVTKIVKKESTPGEMFDLGAGVVFDAAGGALMGKSIAKIKSSAASGNVLQRSSSTQALIRCRRVTGGCQFTPGVINGYGTPVNILSPPASGGAISVGAAASGAVASGAVASGAAASGAVASGAATGAVFLHGITGFGLITAGAKAVEAKAGEVAFGSVVTGSGSFGSNNQPDPGNQYSPMSISPDPGNSPMLVSPEPETNRIKPRKHKLQDLTDIESWELQDINDGELSGTNQEQYNCVACTIAALDQLKVTEFLRKYGIMDINEASMSRTVPEIEDILRKAGYKWKRKDFQPTNQGLDFIPLRNSVVLSQYLNARLITNSYELLPMAYHHSGGGHMVLLKAWKSDNTGIGTRIIDFQQSPSSSTRFVQSQVPGKNLYLFELE